MSLTYNDSEMLKQLIEDVYFSNENGKRNLKSQTIIKLTKDDFYYKLLSNLDYNIKLSNEIINGHMIFEMEEKKDDSCILLKPHSTYCIEREGKYEFY